MGCAPRPSQPAVYKLRYATLARYTPYATTSFQSFAPPPSSPHPVFRRAPRDGTVGLWNPASCEPVRVRGDQVFGERPRATTGNTTAFSDDDFPNPDFYPDIRDLFNDLNMGDNDTAAAATAAAPAAPYVLLSFLYEIILDLFVIRTSLFVLLIC